MGGLSTLSRSARVFEGASQDETVPGEVFTNPNPEPGGGTVSRADYDLLEQRRLMMPVAGADPKDLRDTFSEVRGSNRHEAIDIMASAETPVVAVDDGTVKKLFYSVRGGVTVYQFDPSGNFCYYYAHLDRYAEGLHEGQALKRGDRVAYVGASGDAAAGSPHLHFSIFKLGPGKQWWHGTAINPYPILLHR